MSQHFIPRAAETLHMLRTAPEILTLSVRQPYAHHILFNGKDYENRTRPTQYMGWALLHAGIQPYDGGAAEKRDLERKGMQFGGIVGAFKIIGCTNRSPSPWFYGPFGYHIGDALPLKFMPCRGALGFFRAPIDHTLLELAAA